MTDPRFAVHEKAMALLSQFVDPGQVSARLGLLLALRPRPEDYERAFVAEAAEAGREAYGTLWASPQPLNPPPQQTLVELHVATVHELGNGTGTAREFPGGYAQVASLLRPDRLWLCWRFCEPGHSVGVLYDGLVFLDERFVWFPKPWRHLLGRPGATPGSSALSPAQVIVGQWND
jgi:hypothetical protein